MIRMDFNLPDPDRRNIILILKKQSGGENTLSIIAVTARSDETGERYARRMGIAVFVAKPIDPEACIEPVNHFLQSGHAAQPSNSGV